MLFAAVILLRFYPYAVIYHVKRKGKIENKDIAAVSSKNRSNMVTVEFFLKKLTF